MPRLRFDAASIQRYQQLFGPEHGPVMVALSADLRILFVECEQWERLFGSPTAVEILNQAAPSVAWLIQDTLYDQILLDLAKLVDPVRSAGKANMTLQLLPGMTPEAARASVDAAVNEACTAAEFARENRHKRLAHSDLAQRLENHERLSRGSLDQVRDAVFACAAAYSAAYRAVDPDTTLLFEGDIRLGAESLLEVLWYGSMARRKALERWENDGLTLDPPPAGPKLPEPRRWVYPPGSDA